MSQTVLRYDTAIKNQRFQYEINHFSLNILLLELFLVISWEKSEKRSPLSILPFEFPNVNRIANRICILNLNLIQPAVQVLCLDGAL